MKETTHRPLPIWSRWGNTVAALTALGLVIRLAPVWARPHLQPHGDADFYHSEANLLVDGLGWINPFDYYPHAAHLHVPAASFPPLFTIVLAAASAVGAKSFLAHRIWCCIIGASAVILGAHTARLIGGRRAGLIAAFLIAVYPNLWMSDGLAFSETLSPIAVLAVLLTAYRFWQQPQLSRVVALGAVVGLAALARDELAVLAVFILLPLALAARNRSGRQRLALLAAGAAAAGAVVAPWVGYNLTRFDKPVFISDGLGVTLATANCHTTYFGKLTGYWSIDCALAVPIDHGADESVQGAQLQRSALRYVRSHAGELPRVTAARIGRAFGFYRPVQQIQLDAFFEGRPETWGYVGLGMYYLLAGLAVGGALALRRRGVPIFPLLAVGADVVISVVLTFGQTRYRSTFEACLLIMASVQIAVLWSGWDNRRLRVSAGAGAEAGDTTGAGIGDTTGAGIGDTRPDGLSRPVGALETGAP